MKKYFIKLFAIVLSCVLFVSQTGVFAAENLAELEALSMLPEGLGEHNTERTVTRAEFSYMATRLIERDSFTETGTRFVDVSQENVYSGHIEFLAQLGIINGVEESLFNPEGNVSSIMAYKIIVKILGYDSLAENAGGYPNGYIEIANRLELTNVVAPYDEALTVGEAANLIYEVLTKDFPSVSYAEKDGGLTSWITNDTFSVLGRLKLSAYTGIIRNTSKDGKTVSFEIIKNKYDNNYAPLSNGEVVSLNVKNGIDAYEYENIPISVYVDENEKIISVTKNKHYSVMYTYITGVNGDDDKNAAYAPSRITKMSLTDIEEDFDIADDFSLALAGEVVLSQVKIIGSFAKVVLYDDEICYVDAWQVTEGGLITEITADAISYLQADGVTKKLKNTDEYDEYFIYINGKRTDSDQLKVNSVMDFYENGKTLMITCSEKVISDVLYSVSGNKVEIAGTYYTFEKLYYCIDSKYEAYNSKASGDFYGLLGKDVTAYFAPDGLIRYITKTDEIDTGEFYGVVLGINPENISGEMEIKVLKIYPNQETAVYKITEKTLPPEANFNTSELLKNRNASGYFSGDGIYIFKTNAKNEIVRYEYPEYIKGFGEGIIKKTGITQIPNMGGGFVSLNGKPYFFQSSPIVAVYEQNGEPVAKTVDWVKIYNRPVANATMVFFGKDIEDDPELVVLCGNLDKLGNNVITRGILLDKTQTLNSSGELATELAVLTRSGSVEKYVMPDDSVKNLPKYALLSFYTNQIFSDSPVYINSGFIDLSKTYDKWEAMTDGKTVGFQKGIVSAVSDTRLCVENGGSVSVNCLHPSRCVVAEYDETHPSARFKTIDISDIEIGDTVYYDLGAEGIEAIIVIH